MSMQRSKRLAYGLIVVVLLAALTGCLGSGSGGSNSSANGTAVIAVANTTAQTLAVGSAMTGFSPLTPSGGTAPYTYRSFGTLPAGLSLDANTGVVTGTPTAANTGVDVYFEVKDANNVVADTTSTVHFTVVLAITATATPTAQKLAVGNAMASFSPLTPHDGIAPYTYSISSGTLPAGLSLNANTGAVTGTPTATYATADVVFAVKDASNALASSTSTVNFLVDPAFTATVDTTAQSLSVATAMASFTPVTPSGGVAPYSYSVTSGTLPAGLTLDANTGVVSGIPSVAYATANVEFSAFDANGVVASTTSTVSFTVAGLPAGYVYQGGLLWSPPPTTLYTLAGATTYCAGTINGQTGWRLPNGGEASSLQSSGALTGQGWPLPISIWYAGTCTGALCWIIALGGPNSGYVSQTPDTNLNSVTCVR